MKRWNIYTPEGMQDILIEQCYVKRELENKIRKMFIQSGYNEIETPTAEFYDVFSGEQSLIPQEDMFKFTDQQGRILVLRPDMTIPVARIAATKLKDNLWPVKCCYIGNTFSYNELGGGKQKEFTQAGVEILGIKSPEADAELIALAVQSLQLAGIDEFQIDIGQVDFFKGLMEQSGLTEQEAEEIRELIDKKDFVGVEQLVNSHAIPDDLKELILNLPRYFGSVELIDELEKKNISGKALNALKYLKDVLEILDDWGFGDHVAIDLGMVQSMNYYTGIVFRGFTYGIGFPVLSGGRYDNLIKRFGLDCPATGFSLGINMILMALERQKKMPRKPGGGVYILYTIKGRKKAFEVLNEIKKKGEVAELSICGTDIEKAMAYAEQKGMDRIVIVEDGTVIKTIELV
ncbi:MAG: ATP phosphoribosyltransferase regulatory subunit [Clostridiaceae bacterium]|jgi:ATP phosphoribosyltransferase regulatory subunit|nr:ATP phosphoribosyltransferase regulatory subunit [Clostridiaceae bacterium]